MHAAAVGSDREAFAVVIEGGAPWGPPQQQRVSAAAVKETIRSPSSIKEKMLRFEQSSKRSSKLSSTQIKRSRLPQQQQRGPLKTRRQMR